jgi:hypothetical protein
MVGFSSSTKHWLEHRRLWDEAEASFRREWSKMLTSLREHLARQEWSSRTDAEEPCEELKFRRPHWPDGITGLHYEIRAFERFRKQGIADLSLHVEDAVPHQLLVCARLRKLLRAHSSALMSWLSRWSPCLPEKPLEDILKGRVVLTDATSKELAEALEGFMETDTFVDEALLLASSRTIWRTDFFADQPSPGLTGFDTYQGSAGGWRLCASGGRFNSPQLECQPGKRNHPNGRNILTMADANGPFLGLAPGQKVCACAVVRAPVGAGLYFCLQTGKSGGFQIPFEASRTVKALDQWQTVCWAGTIKDYAPCTQGLYAYLIVKPLDSPIQIDSIELGAMPTGEPSTS